jgi:hypothetical protein
MTGVRASGDAVDIDVLVQPRASRARIGPAHGDRIKVAVTAPPVDGEANAAVVDLFARALRCPRAAVEVVAGQASRRKTVRIRGVTAAAVEAVIT